MVLIATTMLPTAGRGGPTYLLAVSAAGMYLLHYVINVMRSTSRVPARRLVHASVLYLPIVLGMMVACKA